MRRYGLSITGPLSSMNSIKSCLIGRCASSPFLWYALSSLMMCRYWRKWMIRHSWSRIIVIFKTCLASPRSCKSKTLARCSINSSTCLCLFRSMKNKMSSTYSQSNIYVLVCINMTESLPKTSNSIANNSSQSHSYHSRELCFRPY